MTLLQRNRRELHLAQSGVQLCPKIASNIRGFLGLLTRLCQISPLCEYVRETGKGESHSAFVTGLGVHLQRFGVVLLRSRQVPNFNLQIAEVGQSGSGTALIAD